MHELLQETARSLVDGGSELSRILLQLAALAAVGESRFAPPRTGGTDQYFTGADVGARRTAGCRRVYSAQAGYVARSGACLCFKSWQAWPGSPCTLVSSQAL